jgi:hypothetical protein
LQSSKDNNGSGSVQRILSLREAVEVRWAIRGLQCRLNIGIGTGGSYDANTCIPNLDKRVSSLPFDIMPLALDWSSLRDADAGSTKSHQNIRSKNDDGNDDLEDSEGIIPTLLDQIPFNFDTIKTRNGSIVQERRGTAWVVSDDDIGSLAYSGKLMNPNPIPPIVTSAMQQVEHAIFSHKQWQDSTLLSQHEDGRNHHRENDIVSMRDQLCYEETGRYFDCVLCNHYPNDDAACKFHTDPEHGTYWERLTCVVSASGKRAIRKFAFRPIPK